MGPYCQYCDQRCFVPRALADGSHLIMATCSKGMEHDRRVTGQDHTTARNPRARERTRFGRAGEQAITAARELIAAAAEELEAICVEFGSASPEYNDAIFDYHRIKDAHDAICRAAGTLRPFARSTTSTP